MAAFLLQRQSGEMAEDTTWPTKLKTCTIWAAIENLCYYEGETMKFFMFQIPSYQVNVIKVALLWLEAD